MPTTYLGLHTINQSDNVSPTPINDNMEKIDKLGLDYVVAQGTSGNWTYRRWKSGTYECWGTYKYQSASPNVPDSDYGSFQMSYPVTFAQAPQLFVSCRQDGNVHIYTTYVEHDATAAVWYCGGMMSVVDLECYLYAIGTVG